jgi:hypothetical protein
VLASLAQFLAGEPKGRYAALIGYVKLDILSLWLIQASRWSGWLTRSSRHRSPRLLASRRELYSGVYIVATALECLTRDQCRRSVGVATNFESRTGVRPGGSCTAEIQMQF